MPARTVSCFPCDPPDDAVNMCGKAAPVFSSCTLRARKCGVRAYEKATASLTDCRIEACSEQGIKTFESAALSLTRCTLADCEEDGIVAMDKSSVRLEACTISSCKGPAVDLTNQAQLHATGCTFKDSMGAVWVWDNAKADVADSHLRSHDTYVVLADGPARATIQGCRIDGKLHVTDKAQADVLRTANKIVEPGHHVGAPPEDGAFEFVPNKYTRKQ